MTTIEDLEPIGEEQLESKIKLAYRNKYSYHGYSLHDQVKSVVIKDHSVLRWNERVGPKLEKNEIELLFNQLIKVPYRVTKLTKEIAVIDDDIIFIYRIENNELIVMTIYGRLSLKPSLQDINKLKTYNYHHYDRLNLSIPEHILNEQTVPPIPKKLFHFRGRYNFYRIEVFNSIEGEMVFLSVFLNSQQRKKHIDMSQPTQAKLSKKILYILWSRLGYEDFVLQHFQYHYPENYEAYSIEIKAEQVLLEQRGLSEVSEKELYPTTHCK